MFGLDGDLGEAEFLHVGELEERGHGGGEAVFFEGFEDTEEDFPAVFGVFVGAMENSVGEMKMPGQGFEAVIDQAWKDFFGEGEGIEDHAGGGFGFFAFDGGFEEFEVEAGVVGDQRQVATVCGQAREGVADGGLVADILIGNAVDGESFCGDGDSGIYQGVEGFPGVAVNKFDCANFDDGVGFRGDTRGFEIKGYKVHHGEWLAWEKGKGKRGMLGLRNSRRAGGRFNDNKLT